MRSGDVTRPFPNFLRKYAKLYSAYPQDGDKFQRGEIPVDNSEFSTFSTGFSTTLIHRGCELWIFIFGSHNQMRHPSTEKPLFRRSSILPWGKSLCKNSGLTSTSCHCEEGRGAARRGNPPIFWFVQKVRRLPHQRARWFATTHKIPLRKKVKIGVDFV